MMWNTLLMTMQWMLFAYHRKWMESMVGWHNDGANLGQNANAGNDPSNQGETQQ